MSNSVPIFQHPLQMSRRKARSILMLTVALLSFRIGLRSYADEAAGADKPSKTEAANQRAAYSGISDSASDRDNSQLKSREQAALSSEKDGQATAVTQFMQLADLEVSLKHPDLAIEHCRHAIQIYDPKKHGLYSTLLPGRGLVTILADQGHLTDSVQLLREAADRRKATNGDDSPEAAAQLCELLTFYKDRKDDEKASQVLDEVLACDIRRFYTEVPDMHSKDPVDLQAIYSWACDVGRYKQTKLAMNILNRILSAQRKTFGRDNAYTAETIHYIGQVQHMDGWRKEPPDL